MTSILLDTSAYIEARRGNPHFQREIQSAASRAIDPVALGEIRAGLVKSRSPIVEEQWLGRFLNTESVSFLKIDRLTSDRYATIKNYLDRIGRPISPNDLWIAAVAWQHGLHLLTADRHFLDLPQILTIYHPPL
jgi:predicted nucleic acid-binding protein